MSIYFSNNNSLFFTHNLSNKGQKDILQSRCIKFLKEFYGIEADQAFLENLVKMIKNGESTTLKTQANTKTKHMLTVGDKTIVVTYDKKLKSILEVLPPDFKKTTF
jgi:hypothetical protein